MALRKCVGLDQCSVEKKVQGLKEDSNVIANFSCAPMISMDCEGAFSTFKNLLSTKRNCFMEAHLKDQMLIQ